MLIARSAIHASFSRQSIKQGITVFIMKSYSKYKKSKMKKRNI